MTPQLQQAIKLLQYSNMDLAAYIDGELERNPLLERDADDQENFSEIKEGGDGDLRANDAQDSQDAQDAQDSQDSRDSLDHTPVSLITPMIYWAAGTRSSRINESDGSPI